MTAAPRLEFVDAPSASDIDAVVGILGAAAESQRPGGNYRDYGFLLKDEAGTIQGGLTGYVLYDWMFIQFVSVAADLRGQGLGRLLMQRAEDWASAVTAYTAVLERQPQNAAAAFGRAYCLHMSGDLAAAIPAHQRAATFPQFKGIALYNLGCAYARTNKPDEAFEALHRSHEAGFDLKRYLETDTDLESLHEDGRFAVLRARINGGL